MLMPKYSIKFPPVVIVEVYHLLSANRKQALSDLYGGISINKQHKPNGFFNTECSLLSLRPMTRQCLGSSLSPVCGFQTI